MLFRSIVGGGLVGCETALMLAKKGNQVCIVEAMPELMAANGPSCYANRQMLTDLLHFHRIPIYKNSKARQTDGAGLIIETAQGTKHVPAGTVVLSVGYRADKKLYKELLMAGKEVYEIGEAKDGSGNILRSVWDAYEIASGM